MVLLLAASCQKSDEELQREARLAASAREAKAQAAEDKRVADLKESLVKALGELREADSSTPLKEAERRAHNFCTILPKAEAGGVTIKAAEKGKAFCARADALLKKATAGPPDVPSEPVKPELNLPKYTGCEKLVGTVRGRYTDAGGVVIEQRGELIVLEDAVMPHGLVSVLHGYAEDTGREALLNVGRDGRKARVMRVKDKETYQDDQRAHREAVTQARKAYAESQRSYPKARADWARNEATYAKQLRDHEAEVARARADFVKHVAAGL